MTNFSGGGMGSIPPVIKNLLIVNVLVWLAQIVFGMQGYALEEYGALWGLETGNFKIWQLVTYMFMHQALDHGQIAFAHILFNMFALWMFGTILENVWGAKRFFTFYMICGIFAGVAQLVMQSGFSMAVGASGAIMGVMAGFVYLFPNTPLYIMFIPIPVKAKYVIPGFMLLDLFGSIAPREGDNVAHWAHLGGALAGLILVIYWNRKTAAIFIKLFIDVICYDEYTGQPYTAGMLTGGLVPSQQLTLCM